MTAPFNFLQNQRKITESQWTLFDILLLLTVSTLLAILTAEMTAGIGAIAAKRLSGYSQALSFILLPLFWLKKKYGVGRQAVGITKHQLTFWQIALLGGTVTFLYTVVLLMTPLLSKSPLSESIPFYRGIYFPLTVGGFLLTVLAPIAEEVMFRGLIYGYLRKKSGVIMGLFLQGLLFSLLHVNVEAALSAKLLLLSMDRLLFGIIAGILYEVTGSLYPAMIFHGLTNYLVILIQLS